MSPSSLHLLLILLIAGQCWVHAGPPPGQCIVQYPANPCALSETCVKPVLLESNKWGCDESNFALQMRKTPYTAWEDFAYYECRSGVVVAVKADNAGSPSAKYQVRCIKRAQEVGKKCSLDTTIESVCDTRDFSCGQLVLDDNKPTSCKEKMFYLPKWERPIEATGNILQCDKNTGKWMITKGNRPTELKPDTKVFCQFAECLPNNHLFPSCEAEDDDCKPAYNYARSRLTCTSPALIWTRASEEKDWEKAGVSELICIRGKLHSNGQALSVGTQVGCRVEYIPPPEKSYGIGWYIALGTISVLLLIALIFWIILRKTGTKWITVAFGGAPPPEEPKYDFDAPIKTPTIRSPMSPNIKSPLKIATQSAEGEAELKPITTTTIATSRDRITSEDLASREKISAEKIIKV